ncbi:hypothetical protein [Archangium sp.]|uniref:hypothetical protein n=1 Tax=Archangium sp. TaxID=1872627 RepID=UPI002D61B6D6|nr:hypothetical protein [Archangium sp.]HYO52502.1 hypothetical protein [Archangium sp.]
MNERDFIREYVSRRIVGGRPVRWADGRTTLGDFDGREWTLELFDIPLNERRLLQDPLWALRKQVWEQMGRALVFIFHTPEATERHYAWVRRKELPLLDTVQPGKVRLFPFPLTGQRRMDRRVIPAKPPNERAA